jgi:hypothetical protein
MQKIGDYLAEAKKFERMADDAIDEGAKAAFMKQADAYRELAIKRGKGARLSNTSSAKAAVLILRLTADCAQFISVSSERQSRVASSASRKTDPEI